MTTETKGNSHRVQRLYGFANVAGCVAGAALVALAFVFWSRGALFAALALFVFGAIRLTGTALLLVSPTGRGGKRQVALSAIISAALVFMGILSMLVYIG